MAVNSSGQTIADLVMETVNRVEMQDMVAKICNSQLEKVINESVSKKLGKRNGLAQDIRSGEVVDLVIQVKYKEKNKKYEAETAILSGTPCERPNELHESMVLMALLRKLLQNMDIKLRLGNRRIMGSYPTLFSALITSIDKANVSLQKINENQLFVSQVTPEVPRVLQYIRGISDSDLEVVIGRLTDWETNVDPPLLVQAEARAEREKLTCPPELTGKDIGLWHKEIALTRHLLEKIPHLTSSFESSTEQELPDQL